MHDLDDVWRDDRLIEALASREPVDTADPATAPLRALTGLVDAAPVPGSDVRGLEELVMLDTGRSRRIAVRSLAVALTAVATLSTSGVAAVVTGDPFQPAKIVWQQIQERAGDRWGADPASDEDRLDLGSALGGGTGEAGAETSVQAALFQPPRQAGAPTRLQQVGLPGDATEKDEAAAGQGAAQDRAVGETDATDEQEQPPSRQQTTTAEERQPRREERAAATGPSEEPGQQREETQRPEEEQESRDTRHSDQPKEDEQEPTPDGPAEDLDLGIVPDGTDEGPSADHGSLQPAEGDPGADTGADSGADSGAAETGQPDEDTSSTEEFTEGEPADG